MENAPPPVRFGTSGWRGVLGEEVTFPRMRAAVRAVARWLRDEPRRGRVLIGFDGRFASERMASMAAAILQDEGIACGLCDRPLPTPVVTSLAPQRRAAAALVFTASHNAPEYHGMKVFAGDGGCIDDALARRIERWTTRELARGDHEVAPANGRRVDLRSPYRERLLKSLDRRALRASRLRIVYDAMHGVGAGVLDDVLRRAGLRVETLRGEPDPFFGGCAPDPSAAALVELRRRVRAGRGLRIGLASDGDADRLAAVDETGRLLSATEVVALLVDHLARTGRLKRAVAISVATGSLVEKVAADHGLAVERLPIGFKYLSRALGDGRAEVAGEESGGFAIGRLGRDKDGILAGCLLAELVAVSGRPLGARLAALERRHGRSSCGRTAVSASAGARRALAALEAAPPARIAGAAVRSVARADGVKLVLDDGFLMFRRSGTEPAIRIYAEAPGPRRLAARLAAGERWLARAGRG